MAALYVMIPAALLIVALAIRLFFWAVDNGQYEDLDGPAHSILFDDEDPMHTAGMKHNPAESADTPEDKQHNG
ncbi:MAG: cbb3-type cytochrome oxidase assembly protein CcoS [Gammaproteobacteria bacterium]|nr:cbb3-type cytochrome oxidase assembly protein CcoS [Gammaproteobacteria bacterium]